MSDTYFFVFLKSEAWVIGIVWTAEKSWILIWIFSRLSRFVARNVGAQD